MRRATAARRGLRLLWRSSPRAVTGLVVAQVVQGIAPAVVLAAGASLLDHASAAATSPSARRATATALIVLAVALVVARLGAAVVSMLHYLVANRFGSAVDRVRMEAVTALPGLAHFDDPGLADRLQASAWASEAGVIVNYGGYFLRWASQGLGAAVITLRLGWWAPVVVGATTVPGAVLTWRHIGKQKARRLALMVPFRHSTYHAELAVTRAASREVRLFGLGDWLVGRQASRWSQAVGPVLDDLGHQLRRTLLVAADKTGVLAVPFVVAYQRFSDGRLAQGDFAAVVLALSSMLMTVRWLESFPAEARAAAQFLPDLFAVQDLARDDPRLRRGGSRVPLAAPVAGIRFEAVTFRYPGTSSPTLEGLDLWLPAGSSLALVGDNGAGKSTVVKLLCRLYDPDEGRITVDGVDLRELDLDLWRQRMSVLFQDLTRLPGSAVDNVGAGCIARLDDRPLLVSAAREAGAGDLIDHLPAGWDTTLAPEFGGVDLSGGEWQRIGLARALAGRLGRAASVLVLDEPTASLDVRVEHDLYERFAELTAGLTTLVISHRFSTVRMADRVAVLEHGRLVEEGRHDDLVAAGHRYAELYRLQASRFG